VIISEIKANKPLSVPFTKITSNHRIKVQTYEVVAVLFKAPKFQRGRLYESTYKLFKVLALRRAYGNSIRYKKASFKYSDIFLTTPSRKSFIMKPRLREPSAESLENPRGSPPFSNTAYRTLPAPLHLG